VDRNSIDPSVREFLEESKSEVTEFGGWQSFKSGEWLLRLIQKSFKNYYERANAEYFWTKYASKDEDYIADKLISVAAKNASILGAIVGAAVSTDEIIGLITGGEGGIGIPANVAIAFTAVAGEAITLVKFQLQLVANLSRVFSVPLDPDDPEDILTILAFAIGGSLSEAAGKAGMKIGGNFTEKMIKQYIKKEVLKTIQDLGKKIGVKILQRTIIKYAVPLVSIGIGSSWNYTSTKAVGKIARRHLIARKNEQHL